MRIEGPKTTLGDRRLAKEGLKVPPGLASDIKHAMKVSKNGRNASSKRGRKPGVNGQAFSVSELLAAKQLFDALGSVAAAESALAALAKLQ